MFLPNLSAQLTPLYSLLQQKQKWCWHQEQKKAFRVAKEALQGDNLLVHYDTAKPLVLACYASQYGIGAVLAHIMEDKQERPIAYVSRTLSAAEKHYTALEKEALVLALDLAIALDLALAIVLAIAIALAIALAIVLAVKKFHYIFGQHFVIESDHRPHFLFGESNGVPLMASS